MSDSELRLEALRLAIGSGPENSTIDRAERYLSFLKVEASNKSLQAGQALPGLLRAPPPPSKQMVKDLIDKL